MTSCWRRMCRTFQKLASWKLTRAPVRTIVTAFNPGSCPDEVDELEKPMLEAEWAQAGVDCVELLVRAVSGDVIVRRESASATTRVSELLREVCALRDARNDEIQLCSGMTVLKPGSQLGDWVVPSGAGPLEVTMLKKPGPPLKAETASGKPIEIIEGVPAPRSRCHCDRGYMFTALGDFAEMQNLRYVLTSNDDKNTPAGRVMWRLDARVPVTVYLNFRSEGHLRHTGAMGWLEKAGWERSQIRGTVSTGVPNGPYSGPVYSKTAEPGIVELMGSNCSEGTYFVFVELH